MSAVSLDREFARSRYMINRGAKMEKNLSSTDVKTNHFIRNSFDSFVLFIQAIIDRFSTPSIEEDECYITLTGDRVSVKYSY